MPATELEIGAETGRPKTLSASSLIQRALIGLAILVGFIVLSAVLYDANTQPKAPAAHLTGAAAGAQPGQPEQTSPRP